MPFMFIIIPLVKHSKYLEKNPRSTILRNNVLFFFSTNNNILSIEKVQSFYNTFPDVC